MAAETLVGDGADMLPNNSNSFIYYRSNIHKLEYCGTQLILKRNRIEP